MTMVTMMMMMMMMMMIIIIIIIIIIAINPEGGLRRKYQQSAGPKSFPVYVDKTK